MCNQFLNCEVQYRECRGSWLFWVKEICSVSLLSKLRSFVIDLTILEGKYCGNRVRVSEFQLCWHVFFFRRFSDLTWSYIYNCFIFVSSYELNGIALVFLMLFLWYFVDDKWIVWQMRFEKLNKLFIREGILKSISIWYFEDQIDTLFIREGLYYLVNIKDG